MALRFDNLRLAGFKSFVEATEILIEPGLTGVVGPNGCGKSNLVEALRWAMGENSAKRMRGSEMDDVIFAGTGGRPSRNAAEVRLSLDNTSRSAPAAFNDSERIEVSRRIERDRGSTYRVNGREARARDVQLLFADSATGARSTAIVSQGRIGAFIAAKPEQRRAILEEAAGITGLHSRRHEAEMRLRAAEANLERLRDIERTLEERLVTLRRQARQANRYRRLSDHIRRAEAALFDARWRIAESDLAAAVRSLADADAAVGTAALAAAAARTAHLQAGECLPELRRREAEAGVALHRLTVARETLDGEAKRVADAGAAARARLADIRADLEREKARAGESRSALRRLEHELETLEGARREEVGRRDEAEQLAARETRALDEAEAEWSAASRQLADREAERRGLVREAAQTAERRRRIDTRIRKAGAERKELEARAVAADALQEAEGRAAAAQSALDAARAETERLEEAERIAETAHARARTALEQAKGEWNRLAAETRALTDATGIDEQELWPPVLERTRAARGYEEALGAALGEELNASEDDGAPIFWSELDRGPGSALPAGASPLSAHVRAPAGLAVRLAQVGIVDDAETAAALQPDLAGGQRLVTRKGGLWRWDGYTVAPGASTAAARRLAQLNRLEALRLELMKAEQAFRAAETAERGLHAEHEAARSDYAAVRREVREARTVLDRARDQAERMVREAAVHASRLDAARERERSLEAGLAEVAEAEARAARTIAELPDPAELRTRTEDADRRRSEQRRVADAARAEYDRLVHGAAERGRRMEGIDHEIRSWRNRAGEAARQLERLDERRRGEEEALDALSRRPQEIASERAALTERIDGGEERRRHAGDGLARAEAAYAEAERAAKERDRELAEAREERIRREEGRKRARETLGNLAERVRERLGYGPDALAELAGRDGNDTSPPDLETLERRAERLIRERETMGAVNLRAEDEVAELDGRVTEIGTEREDLVQAIAKLRRAIGELNREGRTRLADAFETVNGHFGELFTRLFGGGVAHLTLVGADDPLEAGLEIMACPPGKRMQALSLLSGGERALTALALLFAVFLTNPAPICVLDEVDAPLDDANVDRFCTLLEDIAGNSETRFLVVTHHRLTMARMDRLFGVTMPEQGISQLVSVDLRNAERLRATA